MDFKPKYGNGFNQKIEYFWTFTTFIVKYIANKSLLFVIVNFFLQKKYQRKKWKNVLTFALYNYPRKSISHNNLVLTSF